VVGVEAVCNATERFQMHPLRSLDAQRMLNLLPVRDVLNMPGYGDGLEPNPWLFVSPLWALVTYLVFSNTERTRRKASTVAAAVGSGGLAGVYGMYVTRGCNRVPFISDLGVGNQYSTLLFSVIIPVCGGCAVVALRDVARVRQLALDKVRLRLERTEYMVLSLGVQAASTAGRLCCG